MNRCQFCGEPNHTRRTSTPTFTHPPTHTHTFSQQQLAFTLPKTTAQTAKVKLLFETGKAAPQAT